MKIIDKMIDALDDEIEGAKKYAEKYIEWKSRGDSARASKYREMANDELRHASNIHDFAMSDLDGLKRVYAIPEKDEEKWTSAHRRFAEQYALVKQMLA